MRRPVRSQSARPGRRGWLGRDRWGALVAAASLGTALASGALVAGGAYFGYWSPPLLKTPSPPTVQAKQPEDDGVAIGSVLVSPWNGDNCRLLLIDNATWQIRDHGLVNCQAATNEARSAKRASSAARDNAMRAVFGKR
jgi:hypothetical protein